MPVAIRAAAISDEALLLPMMKALWEHEGIPFAEDTVREALQSLFADPALGRVWLATVGESVAGYAMGTWGFSTEQGGRFLFLDELFVLPKHRGRGVGSALLELVEGSARADGAHAVRLEVAELNRRARGLYAAAGYADPGRRCLAKRLAPPDSAAG